MSDLRTLRNEHRRICVLRALSEAPGYTMNDSELGSVLETFGLAASRDEVRTQLAWLEEQNLLTLRNVAGSIQVVTLSARGADVVAARISVPGVKRPGPQG